MEAVFPASGNGLPIKCYSFGRVAIYFFSSVLLFTANFVLVETIIQIKVKPFLIELYTFLLLLETIFYAFFMYTFLPVKAVFRRSENVFFKESFVPVGGIRIFV